MPFVCHPRLLRKKTLASETVPSRSLDITLKVFARKWIKQCRLEKALVAVTYVSPNRASEFMAFDRPRLEIRL